MHFGYTLRTIRTAAGMSLRRLAKHVGVSPAYLSQVERGTLPPPTLPRLRDIAKALGVPPASLTDLTDRLATEVLKLVRSMPEAVRFLRVASEHELEGREFQLLADALDTLGRKAFTEALRDVHNRAGQENRHGPLGDHVHEALVWPNLHVKDKKQLLRILTTGIARCHDEFDADAALKRVLKREREASTGIGNCVAVPHFTTTGLTHDVVALATLAEGINFDAIDNQKVSVVFLLAGRDDERPEQLKLLARLAHLASRPSFAAELCAARSAAELVDIVHRSDRRAH